jgi:hypothetical protein
MAWDDKISDSVSILISPWDSVIFTLRIISLILLDNNLSKGIGLVMVHGCTLDEGWVVKLLVYQKV